MDFIDNLKPVEDITKMPLYMETGYAYSTGTGVHFSREHPYQLVPVDEYLSLISTGRFRTATADEIRSYYKLENK